MQMVYNMADAKPKLDAVHGFKEVVTLHATEDVLRFMDFRQDVNNYERRYAEVIRNKK